MAPSRLEKFKVLNITKGTNQKSFTQKKSIEITKEQQNQSTSTEKENLKRRFLGPQNTYPRTKKPTFSHQWQVCLVYTEVDFRLNQESLNTPLIKLKDP